MHQSPALPPPFSPDLRGPVGKQGHPLRVLGEEGYPGPALLSAWLGERTGSVGSQLKSPGPLPTPGPGRRTGRLAQAEAGGGGQCAFLVRG